MTPPHSITVRVIRELTIEFSSANRSASLRIRDNDVTIASQTAFSVMDLRRIFAEFRPIISFGDTYEIYCLQCLQEIIDGAAVGVGNE